MNALYFVRILPQLESELDFCETCANMLIL